MSLVFDYGADRDGKTPFTPPSQYEELRNKCPVSQISMWDGSKAWFVTRQKDVRAVFASEAMSADSRTPGFPLVSPGSESLVEDNPTFARMDAPEHPRQRAMVNAEFTHKRANELRPQIQQIVDDLLDQMMAKPGPADLVTEFAVQVPARVICLILGIPHEYRDYFQSLTHTICDHYSGEEAIRDANEKLTRFLADVIERKDREPADDLLSRLVVERERTGELRRIDIISMARVMLTAGFETSGSAIALGMAALFLHPSEMAALREDPSLMPGAVDELLRFTTINHTGIPRAALADTEIGGQQIKAGDGVLAYLPSANFDPEFFDDPETLNVRRKNRGHVAFGYGPHRCLGQHIARVELEVAFETLLRRMPNLRPAVDPQEIRFRRPTSSFGVYELPVSW
ncbi:cytochrome P450 [Micromonospora orduensis]|uniref:Cytochrome P450 n=1 Tax=Micromonospora orduensis TaxID=1420891 RepID=A0A5C4QTX1_9ACTN|nr:cytochrome P450 [Micromonospora orduensis]TNH28010.1 cytochrome P450 [Micromonospora orduensis]